MVNVLAIPLVSIAGQAPQASAIASTDNATKSAASAQSTAETLAQKQRQSTFAAMQAALNKQRASSSAGMGASIGKQTPAKQSVPGAESFFTLAPLAPPEIATAPFTSVETAQPGVFCDAVPEADIAPIVLDTAQQEGLDPRLLNAVIQQESAFYPCAVSEKGALGLMQLMPATATQFGVQDPFDIRENIGAGAKYLKELLTRYTGNLSLALGAYNAGPEKVDKAGGVPALPETTAYVNEILRKLAIPPAPPKPIE